MAAILVTPDGRSVSHAAFLDFPATNNALEYEALLLDLRKAKTLGAKRVVIKSDSRLVASHFDISFMMRGTEMASYLAAVLVASTHFLGITVQAIPRGDNKATDKLAKMASLGQCPLPEVFYEVLSAPSAAQGAAPKAQGAVHAVLPIAGADWRDIIIKHLTGEELEDPVEAKQLQHRARNYHIIGGELFKEASASPSSGACPKTRANPS